MLSERLAAASAIWIQTVPYAPKLLISRDKAFSRATLLAGWKMGRPLDHELQHLQQPLCDLDISLVAGLMKRDQDDIGGASGVRRFGDAHAGVTFFTPAGLPSALQGVQELPVCSTRTFVIVQMRAICVSSAPKHV
jgi:hypothetical protein